jgi:hypothetical protein
MTLSHRQIKQQQSKPLCPMTEKLPNFGKKAYKNTELIFMNFLVNVIRHL